MVGKIYMYVYIQHVCMHYSVHDRYMYMYEHVCVGELLCVHVTRYEQFFCISTVQVYACDYILVQGVTSVKTISGSQV